MKPLEFIGSSEYGLADFPREVKQNKSLATSFIACKLD